MLDLACGGGDFLAHVLAPREPFAHAVGIDVSARALDRARSTGRYGRLIQANIDEVGQHVSEMFSLVMLGEVLYYLADYVEPLAAAVDRLESGGVLFLSLALGSRFFAATDIAVIKAYLRGRGLSLLLDRSLDYTTLFGLPRRYLPLYHQTHKQILIYGA